MFERFKHFGVKTAHANDDADLLIAQNAIALVRDTPVDVICEDTDVICLLWHYYIITLLLNNLNHNISFTVQSSTIEISVEGEQSECIDFLDIRVILHNHNVIETDIFNKETNSHFYLDYKSHHPDHIKNNIPSGLAKRIVVFVTNEKKEDQRLKELTKWLLDCNYPLKINKKGIHNAKLQGPAPPPKNKNNTLPYVTTYYSNFRHQFSTHQINNQLTTVKNK